MREFRCIYALDLTDEKFPLSIVEPLEKSREWLASLKEGDVVEVRANTQELTRTLRELLTKHPEWQATITSTSRGTFLECITEYRATAKAALSSIGWDIKEN